MMRGAPLVEDMEGRGVLPSQIASLLLFGLPCPSSKRPKLEKKPLESRLEHSLAFKKEAPLLAPLHLLLLLEKTRTVGKSSTTNFFDTTIFLEENCLRQTLLIAQFPIAHLQQEDHQDHSHGWG